MPQSSSLLTESTKQQQQQHHSGKSLLFAKAIFCTLSVRLSLPLTFCLPQNWYAQKTSMSKDISCTAAGGSGGGAETRVSFSFFLQQTFPESQTSASSKLYLPVISYCYICSLFDGMMINTNNKTSFFIFIIKALSISILFRCFDIIQ